MIENNNTPAYIGHKARLRERFNKAPRALPDYEILELLLGYVLVRRDTKPLAKELIKRFGTLRSVLDARPDTLQTVPGFGPGLSTFWQVMHECIARHASGEIQKRDVVDSPETLMHMARCRLGNAEHEECWLILLDSQNTVLQWLLLRTGSLSHVAVEAHEVLEAGLRGHASGLIMVHNHPGGNPSPSTLDLALTSEVNELAPRMGMRLIDHIIVTAGPCLSLAQANLLDGRENKNHAF